MGEALLRAVRLGAERALGEPVDSVERIALNSNHVFRLVTTSGSRYSLRVPRLEAGGLTPFWQYLQDTFGLLYGAQLLSTEPLTRAIQEDGLVQAPRLVATITVGAKPGYLSTWVDGTAREPGDFPDTSQVHEQLGHYLARLHLRRYDTYGTLAEQGLDASEFVARTNASMRRTITRFWSHRPDFSDWYDRHASTMSPGVFSGHLSPIMPDIGADQFVYRDGRLAGVVDLDSYVVGPRELELAGVELCLTRPEDFRRGYEAVLPLPQFEVFRSYCRFWVLVCEAAGDPDIEQFLTRRAYFD
jgi:aminoglycoside phosphotransferase (APT) family kinase protein